MVSVSVAVVSYNSAAVITGLLDSLIVGLSGYSFEIVVVDNGSQDSTPEIVEGRADCLLVRSNNIGYAAGINLAEQHCRLDGPLLILNPDAAVAEGFLAPLLDTLAAPGVAIAAPRILNADGSLAKSLRREPSLGRATGLGFTGLKAFSEYVNDPAEYEYSHSVDWALGAAMLIDRRCFRELGGWDPTYFLYSEETDFCLQARDAGWLTVYNPDSTVTHIGGQSGQSPRTHSMQIVNRVRLYRRRHSAAGAYAYFFLTILSELSWLARGHRESATSIVSLLIPSKRPPEIHCSDSLLPK